MLQTLGSDEIYRSGGAAVGADGSQSLDLVYYLSIFKRRFFNFLSIFGLISTIGLYITAIQKPIYLSEGKILIQSQEISPDILTPVVTTTASERAEAIQQRVLTREHLQSIASRFGLFPQRSDASEVLDLMKKRVQIKPVPVEADGVLRPTSRTVAFTVGFAYESPELALRVANELVTLIVSGDERSRSGRTTEMVKLLASRTKDIERKLEDTQTQMLDVARRPGKTISDVSEEQKLQLTALAALKTELVQKSAVYSEAHPAVTALKKRIAVMEKQLAQPQAATQAQTAPDDELEALKRQQQALEKELADANGKLAGARLREKLDQEQQDLMQVIEAPSLPAKPEKSKKIMIAGLAFAIAAVLGLGVALGPGLLNKSIHSRQQLHGVVSGPLMVCIPYIATRGDIIRRRLRISFSIISVLVLLAIWGGLAAAMVLHIPVDLLSLVSTDIKWHAADR